MSIEVWQVPASATGPQLCEILKEFGFRKFDNLFWPGPPGTTHYAWMAAEDFMSTSGVDASVIPLDQKGKEVWEADGDWLLRTRTSIRATSFDKEMQNAVVRKVRQVHGGTFQNDHHGRNRYTPIEREPSTPASRGVYGLCSLIVSELESIEYCLPRETADRLATPNGEITGENDVTGVLKLVKEMDPTRVLYNALVPFLVASIEHFLRGCFEILLKYSPGAQARVAEQNKKVSYADAVAVARGELTLERMASDGYSFQNLDSTQKAYKEILQIDLRKALRKRKKVREKLPLLDNAVAGLIQARHGVVHHFEINRGLDRERFLDLLHLVRALIEIVATEIERTLGVALGPG